MGIREEKKRQLQEKIIAAAKRLFLENEFDDVTMSDIAKEAEVGLGTAYNYYSSKEELFLIAGGTEFIFGKGIEGNGVVESLEELIELIVSEMKRLTKISRLSWRSSLSSLTRAAEKKPQLFLDLVAIDYEFIGTIEKSLKKLQDKKQVRAEDVTILIELIYSTLFTSLLLFMYTDDLTFEALEQDLITKLIILLKM